MIFLDIALIPVFNIIEQYVTGVWKQPVACGEGSRVD